MLKIAIAGAAGRMGRTLIAAVSAAEDSEMVLSAAIARKGSSLIGVDAG